VENLKRERECILKLPSADLVRWLTKSHVPKAARRTHKIAKAYREDKLRPFLTGISIFNSDSPSHRHQGFADVKFEPEFVPEGPFHYAPTDQLCLTLA
jgi:hypothetical protein